MTTTERTVKVNHDQELYVIENTQGGFSCLGFDVCRERIERIELELQMRGQTLNPLLPTARGDIATYDTYIILLDILKAQCERDQDRAVCELSPQLVGLEGHRVEVLDRHDETRRFIVGKSTGWMPCHLEIKRRNSTGGASADREYQSVRDLGWVR